MLLCKRITGYWVICFAFVLLYVGSPREVTAGPPFMTDDPVPIDYQHYEFYVFSTRDKTGDDKTIQAPAIEFNYGIAPDTMVHIVLPYTNVFSPGSPTMRGMGDVELGVKYRFVHETPSMPQIGVFPLVDLPTRNENKGLGNGQAWYRLPVWLQKSWGAWTSYGGVGYAINNAPSTRNYWFSGWQLQREMSNKLSLGGEVYRQGADTVGGQSTTIVNIGGNWNFSPNFSLLFSDGHSVAGASHSVAYLGLYWTWGPDGAK